MVNVWNYFDIHYLMRFKMYVCYQQNFEKKVKIVKMPDFSSFLVKTVWLIVS